MADSAGTAAIVTAVGGVVVSLVAVFAQGRKAVGKVEEHGDECTQRINALTASLADMAVDLANIKVENATLKTEVAVLKQKLGPSQGD